MTELAPGGTNTLFWTDLLFHGMDRGSPFISCISMYIGNLFLIFLFGLEFNKSGTTWRKSEAFLSFILISCKWTSLFHLVTLYTVFLDFKEPWNDEVDLHFKCRTGQLRSPSLVSSSGFWSLSNYPRSFWLPGWIVSSNWCYPFYWPLLNFTHSRPPLKTFLPVGE